MIPPIKAEMTEEEKHEMEILASASGLGSYFKHGYRMGFIAGKLSALNHIVNYSPLYNGELSKQLSSEGQPASSSTTRVEAPGKEGDPGSVHGVSED